MSSKKKEQMPAQTPSLADIRRQYLRGDLAWEKYQEFERALTIRFSDDSGVPKPAQKPESSASVTYSKVKKANK